MKREELEKHLGRTVEITLFDGDTIKENYIKQEKSGLRMNQIYIFRITIIF